MTYSQGYQSSPGMSVSVRPMTDAEREAVKTIPRPLRANAIGMALVSMVMAIMINFVDNPVAILMPLIFCFVGLGYAIQARKSSGSVAQALAKGTVTDVRTTPRWAKVSWDLGAFSISKNRQLEGALVDGVPANVSVIQDAKRVLSVNGVTLRKPVELRIQSAFPSAAPVVNPWDAPKDTEFLPPPPDDWSQRMCPQCGQVSPAGSMFCEKCGNRLR